ncbi:MAG: hypothetical protein F6K50_32485 [Moorea sp. SIO3I7]|nr:hypothetical protein [Moorena sp. SIO3I7]
MKVMLGLELCAQSLGLDLRYNKGETCETNQVHLITHVETTPAQVQDVEQTAMIHQALAQKSKLPSQHFVDAGYVDAQLLVTSQNDDGIELIGPVRADTSWQGTREDAYDFSRPCD